MLDGVVTCRPRADVFVEVFDQAGQSSGALPLLLPAGDTRDPFERNQEDRFTVRGTAVGVPASLSIWTKANGISPDWSVDWASIQIAQDRQLQPGKFYASFGQQWLRQAGDKLKCASACPLATRAAGRCGLLEYHA